MASKPIIINVFSDGDVEELLCRVATTLAPDEAEQELNTFWRMFIAGRHARPDVTFGEYLNTNHIAFTLLPVEDEEPVNMFVR